jgi:osmotically inducible protein OsmC
MAIRKAEALWKGDLAGGTGTVKVESGMCEGEYTFSSRFEEGKGTNPEELIGAAHAGCFSMALAHGLAEADYSPQEIRTEAQVHLEKKGGGFSIVRIDLNTVAKVTDIDEGQFLQYAEDAKNNCPVSRALTGVEITLRATLVR